jgi:hypothetical protein
MPVIIDLWTIVVQTSITGKNDGSIKGAVLS